MDQWHADFDPFQRHLLVNPNCSWVNKSFMSTLEERLASFHTWPLAVKPMPISMAAAGFFHSNRHTDAVTCFCCTLHLTNWKRNDDPIERHLQASLQNRPCSWLTKIITVPDPVATPVPKRAAPMWDHKKIPHKCSQCQKVFSSGNQFRKHKRDVHQIRRRRTGAGARMASDGTRKTLGQRPLGPIMLGGYRVTKSVRTGRVPRRKREHAGVFESA